ncbi:hypothetical protein A1O3_01345 [Capronia epimyces CBS 606.96]|uniref:Capsule synthesis protein CapA domain-containing protein n=1 Tax=Capronia epimyces CBS 606.96 TaxID=1182542 RepID=W9YIS6_9EURO|nr:uncharacterized protein A1O3_01345 [Capronia epimyces CBS 606.96]EXJ92792.1 hypothetical protein A1O3_01345 [Capronia epimyces CBS 606.96]
MTFSLIATGDLVLHGPLKNPTGPGTFYDHVRAADSVFANLEMPFSSDGYAVEKLIPLRCAPDHAPILRDLGIDVVTVANNHGMDYGIEGLRSTLGALDRVGVSHVGGGLNVTESFAATVKDQNGTRVAYIGVTTTLPNGAGAGPKRPGLAGVRVFTKFVIDTVTLDESPGMSPFVETSTYKPDEEVLLQAIRDAKAQADIVLVAIHWGVPHGWVASSQDEIATYQQPLAHTMIDAGASAIFGHHPHVVQGVEFYRDVPIFYSLGNFIFSNNIVTPDANWRTYPEYSWNSLQRSLSNIGALAKLSWSAGKLSSCSLIPLTLPEDGEPVEATPDDAQLLLSRLNALSHARGAAVELKKLDRGYEFIVTQTQTVA